MGIDFYYLNGINKNKLSEVLFAFCFCQAASQEITQGKSKKLGQHIWIECYVLFVKQFWATRHWTRRK